MMRMNRVILVGLLCFAMFSGGCSSGNHLSQPVQTNPANATSDTAALPNPLDLSRSSSEVTPGNRFLYSYGYDKTPGLSNNLRDWDLGVMFLPQNQEGQTCDFTKSAYAVYHFQLPDYENENYIRLNGSDLYDYWLGSKIWVGISNFETNHWEWNSPEPVEYYDIAFESLDPYFDAEGNLYIAVIACYELFSYPYLRWVRVGGNVPPSITACWADPENGTAPLEVIFTFVVDHSDPDGSIKNVEWDFDGDGEYDVGGSIDYYEVSHTYEQPGEYECVLRVTDNEGATDTDSIVITVTDPAD